MVVLLTTCSGKVGSGESKRIAQGSSLRKFSRMEKTSEKFYASNLFNFLIPYTIGRGETPMFFCPETASKQPC